jgi:cytochrome c553
MRWLVSVIALWAAAIAIAQQAAPFAHADAKAGEALVEKDCVSCHAGMFNGDAERIYTRPDRKVKTPAQLLSQVRVCNANLKKSWFPEEEENVAAWLNQQYYKFK